MGERGSCTARPGVLDLMSSDDFRAIGIQIEEKRHALELRQALDVEGVWLIDATRDGRAAVAFFSGSACAG